MYNSFLVTIFAKAWELIIHEYQSSLIKKFLDPIKKTMSHLFRESTVGKLFTSKKSLVKESFFYTLVSKVIDIINQAFKYINNYIARNSETSLIYRNIKKLFASDVEALGTICVFMFFFGVGIIGNNITRGFYSGRSYIIAMILTIGSLIGLGLKENYKQILDNSCFFGFIASIFTIDEGGGNWW